MCAGYLRRDGGRLRPRSKVFCVFLGPTSLMTRRGLSFPGSAALALLALNCTVSPFPGPRVTLRVTVAPGLARPEALRAGARFADALPRGAELCFFFMRVRLGIAQVECKTPRGGNPQ